VVGAQKIERILVSEPPDPQDSCTNASTIVTFGMTFFDHRAVNGIQLPYVITRGANGQTTERWAVSRYRVNESLPRETFTR